MADIVHDDIQLHPSWEFHLCFQFCSPLLASEVVFVKMPLRLQKRKAKRREEYLLNRDYELESSRVQYNADAEQRRASARDMYKANLESNRASKRWRQEKNYVVVRTSKRRRYELNSDKKRASKRESLARVFGTRTAANCKPALCC